jgi:non-heme chloroperoxidase
MVKAPANPGGLPVEVFDGFRRQLAANRAQFYLDVASGPFYGYNRPGAAVSQAVIQNWWRQGMTGGAKAHYDGIKAFSETDFTEDLKSIDVPTLVMHGDDDQIVPIADSALLSVNLLKKGTLKVYEGFPHGMCTTHADVINTDLFAFVRKGAA